MDSSHLLLAQSLSLSALIGAAGAYAGIVRRRRDHRLGLALAARSSRTAVERVDRSLALSRIDRTFTRSAFRGSDGRARPGR